MIPGILVSIIFLVSLGLILSEKLNRTITAIAGALLVLVVGRLFEFYNEADAINSVDFNTLGLLFGMMVLVALLEPTGFFQFLAVWAGRLSKGQPVRLIILLGAITTVVSMFLDNVTTVVLIAPVTILICEILGLNPAPYLIAEALLSNTGGVATLVGDPPNVLIGSAAGLTFDDFLIHSLPLVVIVWFAALWMIRYLFRKELNTQPPNINAIYDLNPQESLEDKKNATKVIIVLIGAIIFFFIHGALHISPAFVALSAAAIALIWVRPELNETLKRIEWGVLIFFASLFVMVGGLEASGVLDQIISVLSIFENVPLVLFGVALIWIAAGLSAIVDNIPITIALIPVIKGLGAMGIDIEPLWWALAFGAGFGGNGTIIGSTANIVIVTLSEKTRTPINSKMWSKTGLPVMLTTCAMASVLYVVFFYLIY
jgi:Na+/H+ antiporter NhaD/arsenite permease-like protein